MRRGGEGGGPGVRGAGPGAPGLAGEGSVGVQAGYEHECVCVWHAHVRGPRGAGGRMRRIPAHVLGARKRLCTKQRFRGTPPCVLGNRDESTSVHTYTDRSRARDRGMVREECGWTGWDEAHLRRDGAKQARVGAHSFLPSASQLLGRPVGQSVSQSSAASLPCLPACSLEMIAAEEAVQRDICKKKRDAKRARRAREQRDAGLSVCPVLGTCGCASIDVPSAYPGTARQCTALHCSARQRALSLPRHGHVS